MKNITAEITAEAIGLILDESAGSADTLNQRTIDLAADYGFVPATLPAEDDIDYSQILSEDADDAVSWLNEQHAVPHCSFYFEDNSLFFGPCIENVQEDVGVVSGEDQEYPPEGYEGEWLHINDHGNATLYVRDAQGNDKKIWRVV
jgi:hypothetical protein